MVLLQQGEIDAAQKVDAAALQLARDITFRQAEAQALFQLGEIALAAGDLAGARRAHEQALAVRRAMKETRTEIESRIALAALDLEEGRPEDAGRAATSVVRTLGAAASAARAQADLLLARSQVAVNRVADATRAFESAERRVRSSERVTLQVALAMTGAEVDAALGRRQDARARLAALEPLLVKTGMALVDLERRALLLRIDGSDRPAEARVEALAIEKDARARGAGLIVRRVQELLR
jgi:tetratricopeptide (TPR) repeat protein